MLANILVLLYKVFQKPRMRRLADGKTFKGLRNLILRPGKKSRVVEVLVNRVYAGFKVSFFFNGSVKTAVKAQTKGIENALLANSIRLLSGRIKDIQGIRVIDIGANYGYLTLVWALTICRQNGRVWSFEPHPDVFAGLQRSIERNSLAHAVKVENLAIGNRNGMLEFNLYPSTGNREAKKGIPVRKVSIRERSLDSYFGQEKIQRCDLIKIDVDGSELAVLQGAQSVIKRFQPILVVETNGDGRIVDFVRRFGYQVFDLRLKDIDHTTLPNNMFCVAPNFQELVSDIRG